jgi:hypothetical protein
LACVGLCKGCAKDKKYFIADKICYIAILAVSYYIFYLLQKKIYGLCLSEIIRDIAKIFCVCEK